MADGKRLDFLTQERYTRPHGECPCKEVNIETKQMTHVEGENKGRVIAYTLSTCVWCKKTKRLLNELGVEYYYVDVDLLDGDLKQQARDELKKLNPRGSYPTIVVDDEKVITGYDVEEIKKRFG